jgi:hypothetical protein
LEANNVRVIGVGTFRCLSFVSFQISIIDKE